MRSSARRARAAPSPARRRSRGGRRPGTTSHARARRRPSRPARLRGDWEAATTSCSFIPMYCGRSSDIVTQRILVTPACNQGRDRELDRLREGVDEFVVSDLDDHCRRDSRAERVNRVHQRRRLYVPVGATGSCQPPAHADVDIGLEPGRQDRECLLSPGDGGKDRIGDHRHPRRGCRSRRSG